jgi:predicted nucleic-acid-binding Zn-ribbon protein
MSEVKKCPKCGGEMRRGKVRVGIPPGLGLLRAGCFFPDEIYPMYCENCGFLELYFEKEKKEKKE